MNSEWIRTIYIFRHGETDWNRERRLQGHTDIPLNEIGREQARSLIPHLQELKIEAILSSDLSRAYETARTVADSLSIPIFTDAGLRETHLGRAEGLTRDEIIANLGRECWENWCSAAPEHNDWSFPGGETKTQKMQAALGAIEGFLRVQPYGTIGVSSHGGVIRRIIHELIEDLREPVLVPNCSGFRLTLDLQTGLWAGGLDRIGCHP